MWRAMLALSLLGVGAAQGADDWAQVKALRSGAELKIYRTGSKQALEARMDEATDESPIVATKKEQMSIPKDQIERIDVRDPKAARGPKLETKRTIATGAATGADPAKINRPSLTGTVPDRRITSSATWGSPPWETVYRKGAAAARKKQE